MEVCICNKEWKREYDKAIRLYDKIEDLKEELKFTEERFDKLIKDLIPEIWLKFCNGSNWESDRPFFSECSQCQTMAITVLKDKKNEEEIICKKLLSGHNILE